MKKILIITFIISILFTGCSPTPDEVKKNMENYNSNVSNIYKDYHHSYIQIENLQSDAEKALKNSYGQFTISEQINFSAPSSINIMEFTPVHGLANKSINIMEKFFSESILSNQKIETDGFRSCFFNEKEKLYCCIEDSGFISVLNNYAYDISFSYDEPIVKIYHTNRKDDLNDAYELNNGSCTVSDAVCYINEWLTSEYKDFSPDFDYYVNTVIVREHNDKYMFQFLIEGVFHEVPIDSYTRQLEISDGIPTGKMSFIDYGIQIQMINTDSIDSFTNLAGIFKPITKDNVNEVISLTSALNYCKDTFSEFKNIDISDIRIMYTLSPIYNTEKKILDEKDNVIITGYKSRPVWEFIIDVSSEEYLQKDQINTQGDVRKYIYLDMITGECNYNFEIN